MITVQNLWELWKILDPDIIQVLPIARRFDQVGPEELFEYGKIKQFELRIMTIGESDPTAQLPFTIYFEDNLSYSNEITLTNNVEMSYFINVPKGVTGTIMRLELGPTLYDFYRYYIRVQCALSGRDTDLEWVALPMEA